MAKQKSEVADGSETFQGTEWQLRLTEVSAGKWRWFAKNNRTGREISDGRAYTKLGRLMSSLIKFFKANQGWMAE